MPYVWTPEGDLNNDLQPDESVKASTFRKLLANFLAFATSEPSAPPIKPPGVAVRAASGQFTVGASVMDFVLPANTDHVVFRYWGLKASAAMFLNMRASGDAGVSFFSGAAAYYSKSLDLASGLATVSTVNSATLFCGSDAGGTVNPTSGADGQIILSNLLSSTQHKGVRSEFNSGDGSSCAQGFGSIARNDVINAIRIGVSTNTTGFSGLTFQNGSFDLLCL